jgi:nicotinamidase-related amidase
MLIDASNSALLVVDVQGRLVPAISGWQPLLDQVVWLIRVARRMDIPVLACEQYPQGLGPTHPLVAAELPDGCIAGKLHFSAVAGGCHGSSRRWPGNWWSAAWRPMSACCRP